MKYTVKILVLFAILNLNVTPVFAATMANASVNNYETINEIDTKINDEEIPLESAEEEVAEEREEAQEPQLEILSKENTEETPESLSENQSITDIQVDEEKVEVTTIESEANRYETKVATSTNQAVQTYQSIAADEFTAAQVNRSISQEVIDENKRVIDEMVAFELQSPQAFEVAVNTEEGYYFVEGQPTYEAAVEKAQMLELPEGTTAVVIDAQGLVTYSNSNVARIFKKINGALYTGCDQNTSLYRESSLSTAIGYVNQCYVDDVAVLEVSGDAAKIMVAEKQAWVKISTDLVFVTPSEIQNPSYYANENGQFVHYISINLTRPASGGNTLVIGPKNTKLKDNTKYYSYDGKYFYTSPETIGIDMRDNVANQAVNATDPYYNYFIQLPFNSKAAATAAQIDAYLNANTDVNSKLRNTGQAFINAQEKYGINAMLMLGIAINESGWGMSTIAQTKNNLFGLNAVDSSPGESANYFATVAQCIDEYASVWLAQGYADPEDWRYYGGMLGNKKLGANVKYASDPYWSEKAAAHIYTVDLGINNGVSKEWSYNTLGLFTTQNSVNSSNGEQVYPVTSSAGISLAYNSAYTDTAIVLRETDASDGKYLVWPARNNKVVEGTETKLPYNWNANEYVSSSGVKLLYNGTSQNKAPVITAKDLTFTVKKAIETQLLTGVSAYDAEDGVIPVVIESHNVNFAVTGVYQVVYKAIDSLGVVTRKTQKVTIVANEKPVITGIGATTSKLGEPFDKLAGVVATDKEDGVLTSKITVTGTVDVTKLGLYTLKYRVVDNDGQITEVSRVITVETNPNNDWEKSWAKDYIAAAMRKNWINTTAQFRPEDSITRAEFIKIVNSAFSFNEKASSESFDDVKSEDWWYEEVLKAIKAEYISTSLSMFRPNDPITREEGAAIITAITNSRDKNHNKIIGYEDYREVSDWALDSVEGAIERGYMGQGSNYFRPQSNITRAETVVIIGRTQE